MHVHLEDNLAIVSSLATEVLDVVVGCEGAVVPEVDDNKVGICEITGGDLLS